MFNYKYTVSVSSWSDDIEMYIQEIVRHYQVDFELEKSFHDENLIIFNFKGEKQKLDALEFKLSKNFSELVEFDGFSKTTTHLTPDILKDDSFIKLDECEFLLSSSKKNTTTPLEDSIKLLKSQKVALIKNTNGYYLVCISSKSAPVKKIRKILNKPSQTLPILSKNILQLEKFSRVSKKEVELLNSSIKPLLRVVKKPIHRLEKIKNIPINSVAPLNNYEVKLPKNPLEEYLSHEVNIPLIFVKVENIFSIYKDVDFILTFEKNFINVDDSVMQLIYGKSQIIRYGYGMQEISIKLPNATKTNYFYHDSFSSSLIKENELILSKSNLKPHDFLLLCEATQYKEIESSCKYPMALVHAYSSNYKEAIVFEFDNENATILSYKNEDLKKLYSYKLPLNYYFDSCAVDAKLLKNIDYTNESQIACNNSFEICHENSFDIIFKDDIIDIDMSKEIKTEEIGSALINSFTQLSKQIYEKYNLPIILCGELFENKNITENIIELFEDNNIPFYISDTLPLNKTVSSMGVLLDFYLKKC